MYTCTSYTNVYNGISSRKVKWSVFCLVNALTSSVYILFRLGGDPCKHGLLQLSRRNYHNDVALLVGCFENLRRFSDISTISRLGSRR